MREVERAPWGRFDSLDALREAGLQDGRFALTLDEGRFECFFRRQSGERLWVLLSAARDPKASQLPKFDRWSWGGSFPGAMLCISDPTLYLASESLRIGWYVGTAEHDWLGRMADLVRAVAGMLGLGSDQVIAYGSSAGGFGSLMLAARLGDATAVAINPQTRVLQYAPPAINALMKAGFGGREPSRLSAAERLRLDAVQAFRRAPLARCLVAQNLDDRTHLERHFKPFAMALGMPLDGGANASGHLRAIVYNDPRGHAPEPRELIPELVQQALALSMATLLPRRAAAPAYQIDWAPRCGRIRAAQVLPATGLRAARAAAASAVEDARSRAVATAASGSAAGARGDSEQGSAYHQWRGLDDALLELDRHGDTSALAPALPALSEWAEMHGDFDPGEAAWKGVAVALRALKLAMLLSAVPAEPAAPFDNPCRQTLSALFNAHLQALLDTVSAGAAPPALPDLHAIAALRQLLAGEAERARVDAIWQAAVQRALAGRFDRNGVAQDNSPGHQQSAVAALRRWLDSGWFAGLGVEALAHKAAAVANLFLLPDGRCLPVGDTVATSPPAAPAACAFRASAQLSTRSGHAIYRDDGGGKAATASYLHLMGAHHGGGRKQADDLSVVWYEGEDILVDPGRAALGTAPMRLHMRSAAAHNTIDIEDSDIGAGAPYGSALRDAVVTDWGVRITARRHDAASGMTHLRHALLAPGRWLLLIDQLRGEQPRRLTRWLHFAPALELSLDEQGVARGRLRRGAALAVHAAASSELQAVLVKGQTSPQPQGWVGRGTSALQPAWALGHGTTAAEAVFATLVALDGSASGLDGLESGRLRMQLADGIGTGTDNVEIVWTDERCDLVWPALPAPHPKP